MGVLAGGRACESDGGVFKIKLFVIHVSDGICEVLGPLGRGRACESDGEVFKIKVFGTRVSDGICEALGTLAGGRACESDGGVFKIKLFGTRQRIQRSCRKRWQQLRRGPSLPQAPGVGMLVVNKLPQFFVVIVIIITPRRFTLPRIFLEIKNLIKTDVIMYKPMTA